MTDKQLDELLRRALAPAEQPPELPQAAPRFPKRKAWMGLAAACLCFVVSAGVFLSMDLVQRVRTEPHRTRSLT